MNFDALIDSMKEEIVIATQRTIRNKSVKCSPDGDLPFGKDIHNCFIDFLKNGEELGFNTKNVDNFAGHIEMGSGNEIVGVLAHLDVVPEGDYWTYPPYAAEIHDNNIYGRGTLDDKAPAIATLYAMKAIKESGVKLNKKVRLIVGLDEESGSSGIAHYLTKEPNPNTGFTPDADFPVIYGEKGILTVDLSLPIADNSTQGLKVLELSGGNKSNMVPDFCEVRLSKDSSIESKYATYMKKNSVDLSLTEESNSYILKSKGVSAHGSLPEKGVNAISIMMNFLNTLTIVQDDISSFINFYVQSINTEVNGQHIGCAFSDKESGLLTFNAGVIGFSNNEIVLTCNLRYPVTTPKSNVLQGMANITKSYGIDIKEISHAAPLYIEKDHPLVAQLIEAYSTYVPGTHEPITIGGGTYARSCDNILAFGPMLPGRQELAHQKDEHISIDDLMTITKIYAKAIYLLAL